MQIVISERARRFGYLFWTKKEDSSIHRLLTQRDQVEVWFNDSRLGKKNIDWRNRRISIGYKNTREIPAHEHTFKLTVVKDQLLRIETL